MQRNRKIKTHYLKTDPVPFQAVRDGLKPWELRLNDRDFNQGDWVVLQEYDPQSDFYSGRAVAGKITWILKEGYGLPEGYCIFTLLTRYSHQDVT